MKGCQISSIMLLIPFVTILQDMAPLFRYIKKEISQIMGEFGLTVVFILTNFRCFQKLLSLSFLCEALHLLLIDYIQPLGATD